MIDRVKVRIKRRNSNYLLKDLVNQTINLYQIEETKDGLEVVIDWKDYERIRKNKSILNHKIIAYYGASFLKRKMKRFGFLCCFFLIGILINLFLSNRILKIDINTPNHSLEKILRLDLQELGIKQLSSKVSYQEKEKIKEKILSKEKDRIEWMEIDEIGTKYIVKVEEKKQSNTTNPCFGRNLIAKKNALITRIDAGEGEIVKKKQDYVSKGEVIVSGRIYNKEEVVEVKCAEGSVRGETWYKVNVSFPTHQIEKQKTGNEKWTFQIKWNNKEIEIPKKYPNYVEKTYDIVKGNYFLISVNHIWELNSKDIYYHFNTIEKEALRKSEEALKKKLAKNAVILRKNVLKKRLKNSKIIVEVFFAVEEDITDFEEIPEIQNKKEA